MTPDTQRLLELAREQSLTDRGQAVGDREQLLGGCEQSRIDSEQSTHDDNRTQAPRGEFGIRFLRRVDSRRMGAIACNAVPHARFESSCRPGVGGDATAGDRTAPWAGAGA
jgi:hypothetical protein